MINAGTQDKNLENIFFISVSFSDGIDPSRLIASGLVFHIEEMLLL